MRYRAIAFDYDGTLAEDGQVPDSTVAALERAAGSGRSLLLVTGRHLDDLADRFDRLDLFDRVVAENGGLLYRPAERDRVPLAGPPPAELVDRLRSAGVDPLGVGEVVVDTRQPHDVTVLEAIRDLGLELQVIYNKGAVMVLPSGVNKATGLAAALVELGLSAHNVAGIGDAENDHAFLAACECSVAVANAVPALKERCDLVTEGGRGAGVEELVDRVVDGDLADLGVGPTRHLVLLGERDGEPVQLPPYGGRVMVAGPSGSGKSNVAHALLERLTEAGYQVCLVDPEGDYDVGIGPDSVVVGDSDVPPRIPEIIELLAKPGPSVVVNLLAIRIPDRPGFFADLLAQLAAHATRYGRPHWLVVDEAHHLLPAEMNTRAVGLLGQLAAVMLITVHPEAVDSTVLGVLNAVIAVGDGPAAALGAVAEHTGGKPPDVPAEDRPPGRVVLWRTGESTVDVVDVAPPAADRQRHRRKYATGTMGPDQSFYFRGPDQRLNLRAHNLALFLEIGSGVDDDTWEYHRRQGDYSRWIAGSVDDAELERAELPVGAARDRLRELIVERYTRAAEPDSYGTAPG